MAGVAGHRKAFSGKHGFIYPAGAGNDDLGATLDGGHELDACGSGAAVEKFSVDTKDNTEGYLWTQMTIRKDTSSKGGM